MSTLKSTVSRPFDGKIDLSSIGRKRVHIAIFGCGQVGGRLIDQLLNAQSFIAEEQDIDLRIFAIANSRQLLLADQINSLGWQQELASSKTISDVGTVIQFAREKRLDNLIAVDNTASSDFIQQYPELIAAGFDLVSSNKLANVQSQAGYDYLRSQLRAQKGRYFYETNVGAGLPLIDTLKLLHLSGEKVTRVRGVFSGSLSYIFNLFSAGNSSFSHILNKAKVNGLTEPDARLDLSGEDVGRKLIILARELGYACELQEVEIQNLIPSDLRKVELKQFEDRINELDVGLHIRRKNLSADQVLRYVADLQITSSGLSLKANLQEVPSRSPLGGLQGSDTLFEIYTPNYQKHPLVIQGAGAGAEVTARGVLGDILRIGQLINN